MSNIIGVRNNNTIVPYVGATKRTKLLTATSVVTISDSFNTTYAFVQFEADSSNNWTMHFFVEGDGSASKADNTSIDITIPGIATKNVGAVGQTFNCKMLAAVWRVEEAGSGVNNNTFGCINRSGSTLTYTKIVAQGSILLNAEPTWASLGTTAAAALEGVTAVDVYIAPASAGTAGLVNNVAGNTVGTPILGNISGTLAATGYVGESLNDTADAGTNGIGYYTATTTAPTASDGVLVTKTVNKGMYLVSFRSQTTHDDNAAVRNYAVTLNVGGTPITPAMTKSISLYNVESINLSGVLVNVTADSTAIAVYGSIGSLGGGKVASSCQHILCINRIV